MSEITVYVRENDGIVEVTTDYEGLVRVIKISNLDCIGEDENYATDKDGDAFYASTYYEQEPDQEIINHIKSLDKRCSYCGRVDSDDELKVVEGYLILTGCADCEGEIKNK